MGEEVIPRGLCQCGCGEKTKEIMRNDSYAKLVRGSYRRFVPGHNMVGKRGIGSIAWRGGQYKSKDGVWVCSPNNPRANNHGYILRHRLIAEKIIGRPLKSTEIIHHYGDKDDDSKIVICEDQTYHLLLHQRQRAYKASGHADWRKCYICKQYDSPGKIRAFTGQTAGHHLDCYKAIRVENNKLKREARNATVRNDCLR